MVEQEKVRQKYVSAGRAPTNQLPNQRTRGGGTDQANIQATTLSLEMKQVNKQANSVSADHRRDAKAQDYRVLMQKLVEAKQQTALLQQKYEQAQKQLQQKALEAYGRAEPANPVLFATAAVKRASGSPDVATGPQGAIAG